jgi:HTH-type transcriptional regulator, transcriptional repressor of NAD biosynthesis genes
MYGTGLTLGKFAPFHRGHQYLIETALREVERLTVIVYSAKGTTDIPLELRAGWIRRLYPQVEVLEAPHGPEATGYTPEIMEAQEDFLLRFLGGRRIDAFFSSEPYGDHVSRALGCVNRLVDPARACVPVSGSMIRPAPWAFRDHVDPLVRADLVGRTVLLGGPSTGKTSLARALSESLGEPWCEELGRDYWFAHQIDHRLSMEDLETIARMQADYESVMAGEARRRLVVDTCPLTTWVYARYYHGRPSRELDSILHGYLALPRDYWLCDVDIPFEDSPDRSGPASRESLQALTIETLAGRGIPYRLVSGSLEERVAAVGVPGGQAMAAVAREGK